MIAALVLSLGVPQAPATCPTIPVPLSGDLRGWNTRRALKAGATGATATPLSPGHGATATLVATRDVRFAVPPARPGDAVSHAGLFAVDVAAAGRYRVALGSAAWIDVVRGGASLSSVGHGHGPACSGIRKMVDFDLTPGRHLVQISGSAAGTVPILVTRLR